MVPLGEVACRGLFDKHLLDRPLHSLVGRREVLKREGGPCLDVL
jgi:hypothetical protein